MLSLQNQVAHVHAQLLYTRKRDLVLAPHLVHAGYRLMSSFVGTHFAHGPCKAQHISAKTLTVCATQVEDVG